MSPGKLSFYDYTMKKIKVSFLLFTFFFLIKSANAQVGIGTLTPDTSAILDLTSFTRGLLLPRITTAQRDLIMAPAKGLMIYNLTINDVQVNIGTPAIPKWNPMTTSSDSIVLSVTASGDVTTSSTIFESIADMALSPPGGTYLVLFNGQYGLLASVPINTADVVIDLQRVYDELMAIPPTNTTHAAVFGNGETLTAGVYNVAGAASMAGTLTLDGGGDTNALFIIRVGGAFSAGAGSTVVLTNGARSDNIYWISEGALSLAANTVMKGTLIAHAGAVSAAAGSDLEGRLFTLSGAISFGPGVAYIPTGTSAIDLGLLVSFVFFTTLGAVGNTEPSTITGDVGSNAGAITGFENLNGNIYSPGAAPPPINNTLVTFSIYQQGVLIAHSSRTSDINTSVISLQAMATITTGQSIDVRWHVDEGQVMIGNRILSLIRS